MKSLIIILLALVIAGNVHADDKYGEFSKYLSKELEKQYKLFKPECDLCACYLGIDPSYNSSQISLRYSSFKYYSEGIPVESDPNVDHGETGTDPSTEYYNRVEVTGRYYMNPSVRFLINIPYSLNNIDGKRIKDFGDVSVIGQYQLYNTRVDTETDFRNSVFVGGGVKAPTGAYNKSIVYGEVEPHFQPGTGSFDFLLSGTYLVRYKSNLGLSTDVIYTINTTNSNEYRFSNRFNVTSTLFYIINAGKRTHTGTEWTFLPHSGVYLESAGYDTQDGADVDDSGGSVLFATGGIDIYYNQFDISFTYQGPVSQSLNGDQPQNKYRFYIGAGYSF